MQSGYRAGSPAVGTPHLVGLVPNYSNRINGPRRVPLMLEQVADSGNAASSALIGGFFGVLVVILGAVSERLRDRSRRRIERQVKWDERRLDLFFDVTTRLHATLEMLVRLAQESVDVAERVRLRAAIGTMYSDLKPLVRAVSLPQMDRVYVDVQQAHEQLACGFGDARSPTRAQVADLRERLRFMEQSMRQALGTPTVKVEFERRGALRVLRGRSGEKDAMNSPRLGGL